LDNQITKEMQMLFDNASPSEGFPEIAELPWKRDPVVARQQAYDLLKGSGPELATRLLEWLRDLKPSEVDVLVQYSIERSSHYKWFLGGNIHDYFVWLHQYKTPGEFRAINKFAASIHDHRLWFCSRVLAGGLNATWYEATLKGSQAHLTVTARQQLRPGMIFQMHAEEIHCIDSVEDNTVTLLIQGPPERHYSTAFNLSDGSMQRNYDLEALYPNVVSALKAAI
jgi:hypothetical protein